MTVVKKIKLDDIENLLENIILFCSRIKVSQEELKYLEQRIDDNKSDFLSGSLSKSLYESNRKGLEKEKKKLMKKIDINIRNSIKKIGGLKSTLEEIKI